MIVFTGSWATELYNTSSLSELLYWNIIDSVSELYTCTSDRFTASALERDKQKLGEGGVWVCLRTFAPCLQERVHL